MKMTNEKEAEILSDVEKRLPGNRLLGFAKEILMGLLCALHNKDDDDVEELLPEAHIALSLLELRYGEDADREISALLALDVANKVHDLMHSLREERDDDDE